ncbi:hypothetical protein GCM10027284_46360 [Cyclobacterium sediminis]
MEYQESNEETIQRYLDDELGEDEKLAFEAKVKADASLQEQVAAYRLLVAGIRFQVRKENWDKISELENEATSKAVFKRVYLNSWKYAVAGLAVLLVATFFMYKLLSKQEDMQDLYAENFSAYPALVHATVRGADEPKTLEEQAYAAYSNEEYEEATLYFTNILEAGEDPLVRFYLGNTYLAMGNYDAAILALERAIESPMMLETQAKWYLGLAYLARGRKEDALIQFKELAKGTTSYSEKAETIIKQL